MTKYLTLISFFCLFTIQISSQDLIKSDSIRLKIEEASGERKLELMFVLANLHLDSEEMKDIAKLIEQEALSQHNMRYLAGSYALKARYFLFRDQMDSLVYYADLSNNIYNKNNLRNPNETYQYLAMAYLDKGYYELAIHNMTIYLETRKNDIEAYNMIGVAYLFSGKYDLAKKYYLEAIEIAQPNEDIPTVTLYNGLATVAYYLRDYGMALKYLAMSEEFLAKHTDKIKESRANIYTLQMNLIYALTYISLNNALKGKLYLDKVISNSLSQNNDLVKQDIKATWFEYYFMQKEYDKASVYLDEILTYYKQNTKYNWLVSEYLGRKVKMLEQQGKLRDALAIQKELIMYKDSINQSNIPLQISELSKSYELEKARNEREVNQAKLQRSQAINFGFAIAIILLCTILYLVRRNAQRLKDKNISLYKQFEEVDKYASFAKEYLLTQEKKETENGAPSLFKRIDAYMNESEPYRDSNLNKDSMALHLGTNRQYIAEAVKSETGKTFRDYINDYRLDYARRQLVIDDTLSIDSIMHDSGFGSNSTFYRLFKNKFGMTPYELRQVKKEIKSEIFDKTKHTKEKLD